MVIYLIQRLRVMLSVPMCLAGGVIIKVCMYCIYVSIVCLYVYMYCNQTMYLLHIHMSKHVSMTCISRKVKRYSQLNECLRKRKKHHLAKCNAVPDHFDKHQSDHYHHLPLMMMMMMILRLLFALKWHVDPTGSTVGFRVQSS